MKNNNQYFLLLPSKSTADPAELVYLLNKHSGEPALPIVKVGDQVKAGQLIARADGNNSANVHSSVSGKVTKIDIKGVLSSFKEPAIFINNDGNYSNILAKPVKSIKDTLPEELIQRIFEAGIVSSDSKRKPMHLRLLVKRKINTIIVNATESEYLVTSTNRIIVEQAKYLFSGLDALIEIFKPKDYIIALQKYMKGAHHNLRNFGIRYKQLKFVLLADKYCNGLDEVLVRQIIKKKSLASFEDMGIFVIDARTLFQIGYSLLTGVPNNEAMVTVAGDFNTKRNNIRVKVGAPLFSIVQEYFLGQEVPKASAYKVVCDGAMRGCLHEDLSYPVLKSTSSVLMLKSVHYQEEPCVRCGKCVDVCPMYLIPQQAAEKGLLADECNECGLCSYYCPSRIDLVQKISKQKRMRES